MGEMFKGPAKYPEWEEWRAWHKHIGEVMRRECAENHDRAADDYREPISYVETDIGRLVSAMGFSWFISSAIVVGFVLWAWITQPPMVDIFYP